MSRMGCDCRARFDVRQDGTPEYQTARGSTVKPVESRSSGEVLVEMDHVGKEYVKEVRVKVDICLSFGPDFTRAS